MIKVYIKKCGDSLAEQRAAAYSLLFRAVGEQLGVAASEKDILKTERGKPYFAAIPVSFNISHCKGMAVCAVGAADLGEIGVDCENIRPYNKLTAKRVFSSSERKLIDTANDIDLCYTRLWTLKESYVKYTGTGLAGHTGDIEFTFVGEDGIISSDTSTDHFSTIIDEKTVVTLCCRKGEKAEFILINSEKLVEE